MCFFFSPWKVHRKAVFFSKEKAFYQEAAVFSERAVHHLARIPLVIRADLLSSRQRPHQALRHWDDFHIYASHDFGMQKQPFTTRNLRTCNYVYQNAGGRRRGYPSSPTPWGTPWPPLSPDMVRWSSYGWRDPRLIRYNSVDQNVAHSARTRP